MDGYVLEFVRNLDLEYLAVAALFLGTALWCISFGIFLGVVKIDEAAHPRAKVIARILGTILLAGALSSEITRQAKAPIIAKLEHQIEGLRTIEAEHLDAQNSIKNLKDQLIAFETMVDTLTSELGTLTSELEALKIEKKNIVPIEDVEQLRSKIAQLQQTKDALTNDLNSIKSFNAALRAERARDKQRMEELVLKKREEAKKPKTPDDLWVANAPGAAENEATLRSCADFDSDFGKFEVTHGDRWSGFGNNIRIYFEHIGVVKWEGFSLGDRIITNSNVRQFDKLFEDGEEVIYEFENCKFVVSFSIISFSTIFADGKASIEVSRIE